jgi:hypothetical protein
MWAQTVNALLGLWLMAAPAVLAYGEAGRINDRIVGPLIATFAWIAVTEVTRGCRWVNVLLGAWLIVAPVVLGYHDKGPVWNSVCVGIAVVVLSFVRGHIKASYGGGWRALFTPIADAPKPPP